MSKNTKEQDIGKIIVWLVIGIILIFTAVKVINFLMEAAEREQMKNEQRADEQYAQKMAEQEKRQKEEECDRLVKQREDRRQELKKAEEDYRLTDSIRKGYGDRVKEVELKISRAECWRTGVR